MKKILIYGLKDPVGGVEQVVKSYTDNFPNDIIACDYAVFGHKFSLEDSIVENGGKVFYLPNRLKQRRKYKKELKKIFGENHYSAVWANFAGLTNIDFLKFGKKYNVPVRIAHSHGTRLYWTGRLMKYLVPLFHNKNKRIIDKYATDFWACSEKAGEFMFPEKVYGNIKIINNAVNTDIFHPDAHRRNQVRKALNIENRLVICHVARMSFEKNQSFMLDIFKEVLNSEKRAVLLFVGDGELKKELLNKARELNIEENVIFTGFKTEVEGYYKASDVFLLPSLAEGLALSPIEAQACGVPCVLSNALPPAADITGCVKFMNLNDTPYNWSIAVLEMAKIEIQDAVEKVKKSNFDIKTESSVLCDFFSGIA